MPIKICHLTSAHPRTDSRIFLKMCSALASHGFEVNLVVADGLGNSYNNNVKIVDTGRCLRGRLCRMTKGVIGVYRAAVKLNADVYHLHDPELITIGLLLKFRGKKVIFDSHEDVQAQMLFKPYLNRFTSSIIANIYRAFEILACSQFDGIVVATEKIESRFKSINKNIAVIRNYPIISEFQNQIEFSDKNKSICYAGGIYAERGITEICSALTFVHAEVSFALCGVCPDQEYMSMLERLPSWGRVKFLGNLNRKELADFYGNSMVGMVTFHPLPNHTESLPTKLFEYMSAGLPVIASNFPLWNEIIEREQCGLCVDPLNPSSIASAIQYMMSNSAEAKKMGDRGRQAVINKYNWQVEEKNLLAFYNQVVCF